MSVGEIKKIRPYETVRQEKVRAGRFVIIRDMIKIGGVEYPFSYEEGRDCVVVLPILNGEIVLIRQYRHALNDWFWEVPAGAIEENESIEETARKELLEETGCVSKRMLYMGSYPVSLGTSSAWSHIYVALCSEKVEQQTEATELIDVHMVSVEKFEDMIGSKQFLHMAGIIAWQMYNRGKEMVENGQI